MEKKRYTGWLWSVAAMLMTLTVFAPLELFSTNASEVWFGFGETLRISAVLTAACALPLLLIGLMLKGRGKELYGTVLFALTAALYIQGNFIRVDYGSLDGSAIQWADYAVYAVINTLGWLLTVGAAVRLHCRNAALMGRIRRGGALFIMAVQTLSLLLLYGSDTSLLEDKSDFYLSAEGLYEVADGDNIIVFVLDAFDGAYFQEICRADPEKYGQVFEDFIYFDNASVAGARTMAALPAILTGKPYPGGISYAGYIEEAFDGDGLYTLLQKQHYNVGIYTNSSFVPDRSGHLVDNQVSGGYEVSSYSALAGKYFEFVLFKYVPHILKPYFEAYTGEIDRYKAGAAEPYRFDDAAFYSAMELSASLPGNAFRLYHLEGAHSPYTRNEYAEMQDRETDLLTNARGALYIVEQYLRQLKELGVYDDAAVVIMADHGEVNEDFGTAHAAHGILFYKEPHADGEFEMRSTPVSYFDLHPTLFRVLGKDKGAAFPDIGEEQRKRAYYELGNEHDRFAYSEHEIIGHVGDADAVRPTGHVRVEAPGAATYEYEPGTLLTFGLDGGAFSNIKSGVSYSGGDGYSWTYQKTVEFCFVLPEKPRNDLDVCIDVLTPYNEVNTQVVYMYANGDLCHAQTVRSGGELRFRVPARAMEDNTLALTMRLPNAVCPEAVFGPGFDSRTLGLALTGLMIGESDSCREIAPEYSSGTTLHFGGDGSANAYVREGIGAPEGEYAWTDGEHLLLGLDLGGPPVTDLSVDLGVMTVFTENGPQTVRIYANETLCYAAQLDGGARISFTVPQRAVTGGILYLRMDLPRAASSYALTGSGDRRLLSLALTDLTLSYPDDS